MASGNSSDRNPTAVAHYRGESLNGRVASDELMSEMGRSAIGDGDLCVVCDGRVPQFTPASARKRPSELICMWCARLRVIVAKSWNASPKPTEGDKQWLSLQPAL